MLELLTSNIYKSLWPLSIWDEARRLCEDMRRKHSGATIDGKIENSCFIKTHVDSDWMINKVVWDRSFIFQLNYYSKITESYLIRLAFHKSQCRKLLNFSSLFYEKLQKSLSGRFFNSQLFENFSHYHISSNHSAICTKIYSFDYSITESKSKLTAFIFEFDLKLSLFNISPPLFIDFSGGIPTSKQL